MSCGGSGANKEELNEARRQGIAKARQQAKIEQIAKELKHLRHGKSSGSISSNPSPVVSSGSTSTSGNCGGELSVGPNTSCGFAENVEADYYGEIGAGSGTIESYSPATGRYYSMFCSASEPHECTGGNDAAVYFP